MKFLLTSAGISNKSMENALKKLAVEKIRIAFIPTAANLTKGPKDWLIKNYNECEKLGIVDIVDISAVPRKIWLPRLVKSNVIFLGGGNTAHLMRCMESSGLKKDLPRLLRDRVYVGISAGSIITAKTIHAGSEFIYKDEVAAPPKGLGFIDFNIRPHLNSPHFPLVNDKNLTKISKKLDGDMYAIDDDSAVVVDGDTVEVVSEGKWKKYPGRQ